MVVTYPDYEKSYVLTPSRRELGRSLGRNSRRTLAENVLGNASIRKEIMQQFYRIIHEEMKKLYHEAKLLGNGLEGSKMLSNSWSDVCEDLEQTAPVLVSFLKACIPKNEGKQAVLVACIGLLVNSHRRPTIVQKLVSMFLYSGHASKLVRLCMHDKFSIAFDWWIFILQVYSRLQKFGMCLSSASSRILMHKLGMDHDSSVLAWKEDLKKSISTNHVSICKTFCTIH